MNGVVTERDLDRADDEFPGIRRFYEDMPCKPRTFLELLARFERWCTAATFPSAVDGADHHAR